MNRHVERWGPTRQDSTKNLQDALDMLMGSTSSASGELTSESRFADAAELWKAKASAKRRETSLGPIKRG